MRLAKSAIRAFSVVVAGSAGMTRAAAIVDYSFVNNTPATTNATSVGPTTVAPGVSSSAINGGNGTGGVGAGNGGGTNGTGLLADFTTTNTGGVPYYTAPGGGGGEFLRAVTNTGTNNQQTEAQSVATAGYWNFVVTPSAGTAINISDISVTGARGGGSQPRGFYIESSIDNPGNTWGVKDIFGIGSEQSQRPNLTTYNAADYTTYEAGGSNAASNGVGSLDLSGNAAYQNITTPIEFRIYVIGPANGNSIDFTDFAINGTETPEPASIGLLGLSAGGLLVRRRRVLA